MIGIIGAGESGVGAAILAKKKGLIPFVSDSSEIKQKYKEVLTNYEIEWEEKHHSIDKLLQCEEIVKSPGIPNGIELIQNIKKKGIKVISEIEFAYRFSTAFHIGITGSNGKTTTSYLLYHILQKAGLNVGLAGNVGKSFAEQVANENFEYYVLEISSFQLDDIDTFQADIGIILNITPDHLDRYEYDFEKYVYAKFRMIKNSTNQNFFIYNQDDEAIRKKLEKVDSIVQKIPFSIHEELNNGAYIKNEKLIININNNHFDMSIHDLALQGKHNLYNSMASGIASRILDLRKELIRESLTDFQNVEHRLERVATIHGIEFINDSKATNVNSTWYALESLNKPVVWIVGGVDKGNDYSELLSLVEEKVKAIVCLGKDNSKIIEAFKGVVPIIEESNSAQDAVRKSYEIGKNGEVVLLSPACASFDLFENYEDRGHQFKQAVRAL